MDDPLEHFCGSPFWDEYLIWNSSSPDFTACFQKTVLVWVPCGFLWLFTPAVLCLVNGTAKPSVPWTGLNVTKLILGILLFTTAVLDMTHWLIVFTDELIDVPYANYNSPFIQGITYLLALLLNLIQCKKGRRSSGVLFIFWLLTALSAAVTFRTRIMKLNVEGQNFLDFVFCVVAFPIIVGQLILSAFSDTTPTDKKKLNKKPSPEEDASFISRLLFAWFDGLAVTGFRRTLTGGDLWTLKEDNQSANIVAKFETHWQNEQKRARAKTNKVPSILSSLWKTFRWPFMLAGVLRLVADMLAFSSPLILQLLIAFISSSVEPAWHGFFYAAVLCGASFLQSLIYGQQYLLLFNTTMRVRAAIISAIYKKALRLNATVKRTSTVGEVVNLMSVDAQRLMDILPEMHVLWSAVIQIGVAMYLLWQQLGPSVLVGVSVLVLLIPINALIAGKFKKLQKQQMRDKDKRINLMNQVLNGIKVLKLYAWEGSFSDRISSMRMTELELMKKGAYMSAFATFVFNLAPLGVTLATFATFVLSDEKNILDPTRAFVSLTLFNIIRLPLFFVPMLFIAAMQATVSFKRMNTFLNSAELDPEAVSHRQEKDDPPVEVKDVTLSWSVEDKPVLSDLTFSIPAGKLYAVVGPVGSGKSSLISGILGDMEILHGSINTNGSVAYVAQQAWIQNATLKDNIVFGKQLHDERYEEVLEACALKPDLEMLPAGDRTEIGEKGINLSGGQKQRISLARAVYFDADMVFLDDPLSAVDSHVGKHIFEKVIGPTGILKEKTRILVTNSITFLPKMDSILVLADGKVSEMGTYEELLAKKGHFADFMLTYLREHDSKELSEEELTDLEEIAQDILQKIGTPEVERQLSRRLSAVSAASGGGTSNSEAENVLKPTPPRILKPRRSRSGSATPARLESTQQRSSLMSHRSSSILPTARLIQDETMEIGKVSMSIYKQYIHSVGIGIALLCALCSAISGAFGVGSNFWLSIWSEDPPLVNNTQDIELRDLRLGIYGGLGLAQGVFAFASSFSLALGCINASRFLHHKMLATIVRSPMSFFDMTPLGRILNRFSKDIDIVDTTIPMIMRPLIGTFLQVSSTIVVIAISTPIFLAIAVPIGIAFYFVQHFYISSSRQLKRLESVTRSPIFTHFSETIAGASTIRAYGQSGKFIRHSESNVDLNHVCYYPSIIANRWLAIRLEMLSNLVLVSAALLAVLSRDVLDPGTVGLSISYASSITQTLTFMVRMSSDLETNIVAVERIGEYTDMATEADWNNPENQPNDNWPDKGIINVQQLSMRYRDGLDLVLKDIDLSIKGGEKIGIVGRTGAGKSSLSLALFRIVEPANGRIIIDEVDTNVIGLHDLRSKLTIIPQDPVLFSGTLKMNLDPFNIYSDNDIWNALELAHLKHFVTTLNDGLDYPIAEGGENLSVGQRQLMCLARALLRKTKVLVLDEATAAVDLETDDLIQATIRKEFADCTIITIAHRLNTIMDSSRVILMDRGTIVEMDSPTTLLENKKSLFYAMAKDAGIV